MLCITHSKTTLPTLTSGACLWKMSPHMLDENALLIWTCTEVCGARQVTQKHVVAALKREIRANRCNPLKRMKDLTKALLKDLPIHVWFIKLEVGGVSDCCISCLSQQLFLRSLSCPHYCALYRCHHHLTFKAIQTPSLSQSLPYQLQATPKTWRMELPASIPCLPCLPSSSPQHGT